MIRMMLSGLFVIAAGCAESEVIDSAESDAMPALPVSPAPVVMPGAGNMSTPFMMPGIAEPKMYPADSVTISEESPIIGVIVNGEARAYLCLSMSSPAYHVVNDRIGTTPVSVVYCDRTDCARVLTGDFPDSPISLSLGGFMNNELTVQFQGRMYSQSSTELPLSDHDFVRTSWGEWKEQYPDSVVFLGNRADE